MNTPSIIHSGRARQRGVVLFFALVALLAMSLAAVALIRSVDTSTIIAGNLSFKRAATTAGDEGIEQAIAWLTANTSANVYMNVADPLNQPSAGGANPGYYPNLNQSVNLTNGTGIQWTNADSMLVTNDDGNGNAIRYVIQRMCLSANALPATQELPAAVPPKTACLFSAPDLSKGEKGIPLPQDVCNGPGCPLAAQNPQLRITARIVGPRLTVSYVQAFVY